jgi:hypothetical protein
LLSIALLPWARLDRAGVGYAVLSGAIASGVGYVNLVQRFARNKSCQCRYGATERAGSSPAAGGILFLSESITVRFLLASIAVLGGIALVVIEKTQAVLPD